MYCFGLNIIVEIEIRDIINFYFATLEEECNLKSSRLSWHVQVL